LNRVKLEGVTRRALKWHEEEVEDSMNVYLISDTHLKHEAMKTYCLRPPNFSELIHKNVMNTVKPEDTLIHLGDVGIGRYADWEWMVQAWPGRKVLIRGNHDRAHSVTWWMNHGFHFACDSMVFRNVLLTHEPANAIIKSDGHRPYGALEEGLPQDCELNVHGHLHNIWDGFNSPERMERDKALLGIDFTKRLKHPWQRLFAVEYTNYMPVNFDKFISQPDKYQSRGPRNVPQR
jgi:calcineurin-like phosphoesterase family protein